MLNAILTALSPKPAPQAGATQKPGTDPAAARFDDVYGKTHSSAHRRDVDRGNSGADRKPADKVVPETEQPATAPAQSEPLSTAVAFESTPSDRKDGEIPGDMIDLPVETVTVENDEGLAITGTQPAAPSEPAPDLRPTTEQKAAALEISHLRPAAPEPPRHATEPSEDLSVDKQPAARIVATVGSGDTDSRGSDGDRPPRDGLVASGNDVEEAPSETRREPTARNSGAFETTAPATRGMEVPQPRAADIAPPTAPATEPAPVGGSTSPAAQSAALTTAQATPASNAPTALIEQLAVAVKQSGDGRVDLTLSPAELGRVRLTLLTGETGITVAIRADRDDTLDLFRRNSDALAQEFRQMGYGSVGFDFGGGNRPGQQQAQDVEIDASGPDGPTAPLPVGILRLTGLGGLDIRI